MNIPESERQVLADFKFSIPELAEWKKFGNPLVGFFVEDGHITKLTLSGLRLTKLPTSIGNLKELRFLILTNNLLKSFPKSFKCLINLERIQLGYNKFHSLPDWFENLTNLKEIQLGCNKFSSVPDCLKNLKSLMHLSLRDNKLHSLPEWFGNLKNLEILYLNDNDIPILPESFRNLSRLGEIGLRATGLRSFSNIPKDFIDHLDFPDVSWPWPDFNSKGNYPSRQAQEIIGGNVLDFMRYYSVSPLELAAKYVQDQDSLTTEERDRLAWEGGFRERNVIELGKICLDDSILAEINKRLTIKRDNGLELIK